MGLRRQLAPPQPNRPLWNTLTEKEQAVLAWIKTGCSYAEAGRHVGTSEQVVKNVMREIYHRLRTRNKMETVMLLLREKEEALRGAQEGQDRARTNGNRLPSHLNPATADELEDRNHAKDVITTIGKGN